MNGSVDPPTLIDRLSAVAIEFCRVRDLSMARVSTLVFNDGQRLSGLVEGRADIRTRTFEKAMHWFSGNWPDGAVWPEGVERPSVAATAADPRSDPKTGDDAPLPAGGGASLLREAACRGPP